MNTHILRYNGERVDNRTRDVYFAIKIDVDGAKATVDYVGPWSSDDADYMKDLNSKKFYDIARGQVQDLLDSLEEEYTEDGNTHENEIALFEGEFGVPGIEYLLEF